MNHRGQRRPGGGLFDELTVPGINSYEATFETNGIPFTTDLVTGGHEWYTWRQELASDGEALLIAGSIAALPINVNMRLAAEDPAREPMDAFRPPAAGLGGWGTFWRPLPL
jgi:hypothetical protein